MEQKKYWKGLEELKQDPAFLESQEKEFPEDLPLEDLFKESIINKPTPRRDFLKLMGFSTAAATLAASCKIPVNKAIPYVIKPEEIIPGVANYYASSYIDGSDYCSILVKSRDGRPIKIEGNSLSNVTKGGTNARAQASILSLYDRSRFEDPFIAGKQADWLQADNEITKQLAEIKAKNGNIRILSSSIISPTTKKVIADFIAAFPNTKHVVYEPISNAGMLIANEKSFGKKVIPGYNIDKANIIVSFDADFLGTWISPIEFTKGYVKNRKVNPEKPEMSRHFQFESRLSLSGSNADIRVTIKPSEQGLALLSLYNKIGGSAPSVKLDEATDKKITLAAAELIANKGQSLVICGSNDSNIQMVVNAINDLLGNYGKTIDLNNATNTHQGMDTEFLALVNEMNAGTVNGLIIYHANPSYNFSNAKQFNTGLQKVGLTISFNERMDETTSLVKYACPDHNFLESWNDAEPRGGMYSLAQPVIAPLYRTRQAQESLLKWSGNTMDYHTYLLKNWESNFYSKQNKYNSFQTFWDNTLREGIFENNSTNIAGESATAAASKFSGSINDAMASINSSASSKEGYELVLYEKVSMGNGKYSNNPWLHELPDPVTKVVWDNYVTISPADFKTGKNSYSINDGDIVTVKSANFSLDLPVVIQYGQAKGTIGIALGYGREKSGFATNGIGKNAYPFVSSNGETMQYWIGNVSMNKTGGNETLAKTQSHNSIEGRPIIKETTLEEFKKNSSAGNEDREEMAHLKPETLYPQYTYQGHKWGMSIDLNSCIGCGACVVGCTAENNVPVVGKEEVRRAHEMHWLRIDRYYSGNEENPEVVFQPMLCQHCENAPCENVCPVAATNHSSEGLNQMAYNRCIGTRYCANNCPYKVRRFNWFDYTAADSFPWNTHDTAQMTDNLTRMVLNPDVTVRSRGVMEKCSFCVQKIQEGKLNAKKEERPLKDLEIRTACQSACPADAIVFGDMNLKDSAVSILNKNERTFNVLADIHTLPSIGYLTKVRNRKEEELSA